jgi:Zn-dependent peptidase ImmA (M78 family)
VVGNVSYSIITIIKCIDSFEKVSLKDIKEFNIQKEEISAHKANIVSRNAFEENIVPFAKKKGMGLLRYRSLKDLEWRLQRSPSHVIDLQEGREQQKNIALNLHSEEYQNNYYDCQIFYDGQYTNSFAKFMRKLIFDELPKKFVKDFLLEEKKVQKKHNIVNFIDDNSINQLVNKILIKIDYNGGKVSLEKILNVLKIENNLNIFYNQALKKDVLGEINFQEKIIFIDNQQCSTLPRIRFTVAHEVAHFLLGHKQYMNGEQYRTIDEENLKNVALMGIGIEDIIKMEWQANQLASFLLLPLENFLQDVFLLIKEYKIINRGFGILYVDNQGCNIKTFIQITSRLMYKYKVSRKVIELLLNKLGILNQKNSFVSFQDFEINNIIPQEKQTIF